MKGFPVKLSKPMPRTLTSLFSATFTLLLAALPATANAGMQFTELRGVAEHLGAHSLAIDLDWFWGTLLLLAVVVTLWVFHRRDRSK